MLVLTSRVHAAMGELAAIPAMVAAGSYHRSRSRHEARAARGARIVVVSPESW